MRNTKQFVFGKFKTFRMSRISIWRKINSTPNSEKLPDREMRPLRLSYSVSSAALNLRCSVFRLSRGIFGIGDMQIRKLRVRVDTSRYSKHTRVAHQDGGRPHQTLTRLRTSDVSYSFRLAPAFARAITSETSAAR